MALGFREQHFIPRSAHFRPLGGSPGPLGLSPTSPPRHPPGEVTDCCKGGRATPLLEDSVGAMGVE